MSNSAMPKKGSHGWAALSHMWRAEATARVGDRASYENHIRKAHVHVGNHVKALTVDGKHDEATHFNTSAQKYLKRLDSLITESESRIAANRADKPTPDDDGVSKSETLTKAFNPNYDYKHFHDLSPNDKLRASHAFNERDMESHYYPVDKKSGEMAHAPRLTAEMLKRRGVSVSAPKKPTSSTKPIPANQRVGARVKVNAPGHMHHGRSGVVQVPNPSMMDRVNVRLSTKEGRFESAYLAPHQVELHSPSSIQKSESSSGSQQTKSVISKAERTLRVIKGKRRK